MIETKHLMNVRLFVRRIQYKLFSFYFELYNQPAHFFDSYNIQLIKKDAGDLFANWPPATWATP